MDAIQSVRGGNGGSVDFSLMLNIGVKRLARINLALKIYVTLAPKCYVYCFSVES